MVKLTHFRPVFRFYETSGFLIFFVDREREHWHEMVKHDIKSRKLLQVQRQQWKVQTNIHNVFEVRQFQFKYVFAY